MMDEHKRDNFVPNGAYKDCWTCLYLPTAVLTHPFADSPIGRGQVERGVCRSTESPVLLAPDRQFCSLSINSAAAVICPVPPRTQIEASG